MLYEDNTAISTANEKKKIIKKNECVISTLKNSSPLIFW